MKHIYLYVGDEQSSIKKRIYRTITSEGIDEFNIATYDGEVDLLDNIIEDALTIPFIGEKKVVIVKNPIFLTKNTQVKDYTLFLDYLKKPMESTCLIINAGALTLDEKNKAVVELKKKAETITIKSPSEIERYAILKTNCTHAGIHIKEEAIKKFFELIGTNNLERMKTETKKLMIYTGKGGVITSEVVEELVLRDYETDVFSFTNAIIKKEKERAFQIYQDLILGTTDPVSLINQVGTSMRNMYAVGLLLDEGANQADIASRLNIKSGYAYNLINNYKSMEMARIKQSINKLAELDYKIKSGKVSPKNGLEMFILEI